MMAGMAASPASAQFFLQNYDYAGTGPAATTMPLAEALPGATPDEAKAALVWTMRSALNVAALQCQFEPTLLAVGNYNAMLLDHKDELKTSWDRLSKYFTRTAKTVKEGQATLDRFGTRTYSSFATVASQYGFCRTAHSIGRDVLFAPRGELATIADADARIAQQPDPLWRAAFHPVHRLQRGHRPQARCDLFQQEGGVAGEEVRHDRLAAVGQFGGRVAVTPP